MVMVDSVDPTSMDKSTFHICKILKSRIIERLRFKQVNINGLESFFVGEDVGMNEAVVGRSKIP